MRTRQPRRNWQHGFWRNASGTLPLSAIAVLATLASALVIARGNAVPNVMTVAVGQQNDGAAKADQYNPSSVGITVGDTIRWEWFGGVHDVTSYAESTPGFPEWQSGLMAAVGDVYERQFSSPGSFTYYCSIHAVPQEADPAVVEQSIAAGKMVGLVIVSAPVTASSSPTQAPPSPTPNSSSPPAESPSPTPASSSTPVASPSPTPNSWPTPAATPSPTPSVTEAPPAPEPPVTASPTPVPTGTPAPTPTNPASPTHTKAPKETQSPTEQPSSPPPVAPATIRPTGTPTPSPFPAAAPAASSPLPISAPIGTQSTPAATPVNVLRAAEETPPASDGDSEGETAIPSVAGATLSYSETGLKAPEGAGAVSDLFRILTLSLTGLLIAIVIGGFIWMERSQGEQPR